MTDKNSTRGSDLLSYIAESPKPTKVNFESWLINWTTYNDTERRFLYPPDHYRAAMRMNRRRKFFRKDLDLSAKFFFSLRFFLENTTASWFYRATDDTIVNFKNLGPYMEYLEKRYDPLTQSVVIGNCIDIKRFSYLQGGVGILFSRVAAQRMTGKWQKFMSGLNRPEDVYLAKLMVKEGVSLYEATSEFFIGHDIYLPHRQMFWNKTLHELPGCPSTSSIWAKACRRFVSPVADLVFWHQEGKNRTLDQTIMFSKWVMAQPRKIHWWIKRGRPRLCISRRTQKRIY
jgi:hypothetical protein